MIVGSTDVISTSGISSCAMAAEKTPIAKKIATTRPKNVFVAREIIVLPWSRRRLFWRCARGQVAPRSPARQSGARGLDLGGRYRAAAHTATDRNPVAATSAVVHRVTGARTRRRPPAISISRTSALLPDFARRERDRAIAIYRAVRVETADEKFAIDRADRVRSSAARSRDPGLESDRRAGRKFLDPIECRAGRALIHRLRKRRPLPGGWG